jgi:hypothetical protein
MNQDTSPAHIFATHALAEEAIQILSRSGFDMHKLSLIGKGYHSEEHPIGFYTMADKIKTWGGAGAFWGGIWGMLLAPAVFLVPGFGLLAMAGPMVSTLIGALEGAVVLGGVGAIGAALTHLGVRKDEVIKYETALKADQYVLLVHGDEQDRVKVKSVLAGMHLTAA